MKRVVVVGGGVIGLSAAFALCRRGCQVTVVEARAPGRGASFVNAGWVCPSLSEPVPAPGLVRTSMKWMWRSDSPLYIQPRADLEFARWLTTFWRRCNARDYQAGLEATAALNQSTFRLYDEMTAAGVRFEEHRTGILFAYIAAKALLADLKATEALAGFGHSKPDVMWGDAARAFEPALSDAIIGGFWMSQERHVRPDTLTSGLATWLTEQDVEIRANAPVVEIEHAGGKATAVATSQGRIETDAVVLAAGVWTAGLARSVGVRLPIQAGKGYHLDFAPSPRPVGHALYLHEARVACTPLNGMTRLAGTMEFSGINERIRPERVTAIARTAARCLRDWPADASAATVGSGLRPMTPDGLPVIGWLPGFRNLAVASGHAMLGVTLAPATADALAELLTTGRGPETLRPFDPARFG